MFTLADPKTRQVIPRRYKSTMVRKFRPIFYVLFAAMTKRQIKLLIIATGRPDLLLCLVRLLLRGRRTEAAAAAPGQAAATATDPAFVGVIHCVAAAERRQKSKKGADKKVLRS